MSVEVKTPTKTQFEHVEFQCGERTPPNPPTSDQLQLGQVGDKRSGQRGSGHKPGFMRQNSNQGQQKLGGFINRKRRSSDRVGGVFGTPPAKKKVGKHGKPEKIVLPSKFLLGGNINDPLNLNSLCDEDINRALNVRTPQSSPVPTPQFRQQVKVMIPPDISDPLSLNTGESVEAHLKSPKSKKKRNKNRKRRSTGDINDTSTSSVADLSQPLHIEVNTAIEFSTPEVTDQSSEASAKLKKIVDKIVSPVIPQTSPKLQRRKRAYSESEGTKHDPISTIIRPFMKSDDNTVGADTDLTIKPSPQETKPKFRRQGSNQKQHAQSCSSEEQQKSKSKHKNALYIYGNYTRYYGYRNPESEEDHRIKSFRSEWFVGKDVLDIGCNTGHLTLLVARDYSPKKIVGLDIDGKLISIARKNVRHYISTENPVAGKYPVSMALCYGPVATPAVQGSDDIPAFPNNVAFVQGNYVLENDQLLDLQAEEYDTILALSLTKWVHLNFGDDGLKRMFRRMYRQLRPGGRLILEPQSWTSYKKKKRLTDTIFSNFQNIKFKPEHFSKYLLSKEVGFSTCELIDVPFNRSKGFMRPIQVFTKGTSSLPGTAYNTPDPQHF